MPAEVYRGMPKRQAYAGGSGPSHKQASSTFVYANAGRWGSTPEMAERGARMENILTKWGFLGLMDLQ